MEIEKIFKEYSANFVDVTTYEDCELKIIEKSRNRILVKPMFKETHLTADIKTGDQQGRNILHIIIDELIFTRNWAFCFKNKEIVAKIELEKIGDVFFFDTYIEFRVKDYSKEDKRILDKIIHERGIKNRKLTKKIIKLKRKCKNN